MPAGRGAHLPRGRRKETAGMWKRLLPYLIALLLFVIATVRLYDRGDVLGVIINSLAAVAVIVGLIWQLIARRRERGKPAGQA
jgi:hypothetical protein